jgi:glycolate oxidase iron-sulfur subunit
VSTPARPGAGIPVDVLNTCVHCGLCLPACPTYLESMREQSSPRGRLRLMRSVSEGRLDVLDPVFNGQMYECLDCRACETACPSGVVYGAALEAARGEIEGARRERGRRAAKERLLRWLVFKGLLGDMRAFRAAARLARLYQSSGLQAVARRTTLVRLLGLEWQERQLPRVDRRFFVPKDQVFPSRGERRGRVALLAGCVMHTAYAAVDRASVRLLVHNGWEVVVPAGQGCCGALHMHAGEPDGARRLMCRNIEAFEQADADVVVANAAGCGAALKEYARALADDPAWAKRARSLSGKARDLAEVLAEAPLRGRPSLPDTTVTYQEACHLAHAQRISAAPRALLSRVEGLRLVEMDEPALCCGSAGIYSLLRPELSSRLQERKLDRALATGAQVIVTANPGCLLQLESGLARRGARGVRVRHIADLLDETYRRGGAAAKDRRVSPREG